MKKISSETTYLKKIITHTIEINGKEVRVYEHRMQDNIFDGYDYDTEIDKEDKKNLTDNEIEELEDNLSDLIAE